MNVLRKSYSPALLFRALISFGYCQHYPLAIPLIDIGTITASQQLQMRAPPIESPDASGALRR